MLALGWLEACGAEADAILLRESGALLVEGRLQPGRSVLSNDNLWLSQKQLLVASRAIKGASVEACIIHVTGVERASSVLARQILLLSQRSKMICLLHHLVLVHADTILIR